MSSLSWITRGELARISCPYCGREIGPDDERMLAAERAWGFVGAGLKQHGERTALLLLAPVPETRDAMLLCLWVAPGHVHTGQGRRLVQAAAAGLLSQNVEAILARGSRVKKDCASPPADFLKAVGFTRPLDERLWRLDLDATVTERAGLRSLLGRLMTTLRPIGPEPAGRVTREG
ncbi:MAG: hypothetical protein AAGC63_06030 [Propionicimonas sp.]|nr:hypothetical protein [Propionicimonas sp.]